VLLQLSGHLRADLRAIAASHDIRYPVLHHHSKVRSLVSLAERGHGFAGIFESIAVQAVMNRNAIQGFDARYLGEFVHNACGEKELGSDAARAVGAFKRKAAFYRPDIRHPCRSKQYRLVTAQFLPGFSQECGGGQAFTSKQPMDGLRSAIARLVSIAKQNLPMASSQDQGRAQSGRPAANDDHIDFHAEHLSVAAYMGRFRRLRTPSAC
jgi:hypothetical protein